MELEEAERSENNFWLGESWVRSCTQAPRSHRFEAWPARGYPIKTRLGAMGKSIEDSFHFAPVLDRVEGGP